MGQFIDTMKRIVLLHFNDVYNIEAAKKEPVGGAARFATLVKRFEDANPLLLFSGDCFSPSLMSTLTRGKQMPPVLNALGVQVACLGNHDLDFGLDHFKSLVPKCNFPWLAANVYDKTTGQRLGDLEGSTIVEWNGVKVGIFGLVEEEWLTTLATIDPDDIDYRDFVECGRQIALELKSHGVELVIALTHMRQPNDILLLESVSDIDIVMGGHDHGYNVRLIEAHRNLLAKSGTDFRDLTKIDVCIDDNGQKVYGWDHLVVTGDIPEDPEVKGIVDEYVDTLGASLDQKIGFVAVDLDGRFQSVRTGETNLGNFICDVLRQAARSDVCLINSGTFRSDRIHPRGPFTKRDMLDILPMIDETTVLKLKGRQIIEALENGVSQYPKLEGRFLQVSGIRFAFDPSLPAGNRIVKDSVYIVDKEAALNEDEEYSVCTKEYLAEGKDGFDVFKEGRVCIDCEESPVLPTCLRYHFMMLDVLNVWKREVIGTTCSWVKRFAANMKKAVAEKKDDQTSKTTYFDEAVQSYAVAPHLEGRIVCV